MDETQAAVALRLEIGVQTDVGLKRQENQDSFVVQQPASPADEKRRGTLLVVADGMGGARGGATASKIACEVVTEEYYAAGTESIAQALARAVESANRRILGEATANPELRGMGTTMSALAICEGAAHFAHIGDSRIYLVRRHEITQLTKDSTLVAAMVAEGLITEEQAQHHPQRNILQRSLGVKAQVDFDLSAEPLRIAGDDIFLLCSDGLHGLATVPQLRDYSEKLVPRLACERLVDLAKSRGGHDNITVIVARLHGEPADAAASPRPGGRAGAFFAILATVALAGGAAGWLWWSQTHSPGSAHPSPNPRSSSALAAAASPAVEERLHALRDRLSDLLARLDAALIRPEVHADAAHAAALEALRSEVIDLVGDSGGAEADRMAEFERRIAAVESSLATATAPVSSPR